MKIKPVIYIENIEELQTLLRFNDYSQVEIILGAKELSRTTSTTLSQMHDILIEAKKHNISVVLLWDALFVENNFHKVTAIIKTLPLHEFSAVRVQDTGALEFLKNNYSWLKIQLLLETGNHNLAALKKWRDYLGDQIDRLILSNELSKEMVNEYGKTLTVPLEVQVMGRILLFYTPRKLLSPLEKSDMERDCREAFGTSEESPHSGFPIIENSHGTFMFNVKDLYLLEHLEELQGFGITHARVDLRFDNTFQFLHNILAVFHGSKKETDLNIKKNHTRPMIKGFFNINKTDVLFTKLKNKRTQRQDINYVGEIVDVERDQQLALMVKNPIEKIVQYSLKFITPEGKEKVLTLAWVKSSTGEPLNDVKKHDLILIPYTNGVTVKTQVYLNNRT